MLVLTRKKGESIIIVAEGREIEIVVKHITPTAVRIGVEAPQEFGIRRSEIPVRGDREPG